MFANPYWARKLLLLRQVMHDRALSNKINNDRAEMAIVITLLGFNDFGRAVTPFFDGSFSLPIFYV